MACAPDLRRSRYNRPVSVADVQERATRRGAIVPVGPPVRLLDHLRRERVLGGLVEAVRAEEEVAVPGLVVFRQARAQRVGPLAQGDVERSALESEARELLDAHREARG